MFSAAYGEKMHPGLGPQAEADLLYVRQLQICERLQSGSGEFVLWDVGLGAAANALTAIRMIRESLARGGARFSGHPNQLKPELQHPAPKILRLVSFDHTTDAAAFALEHGAELGYVAGYESALAELLRNHSVKFGDDGLQVEWTLEPGDFPAWLKSRAGVPPAPQTLPRERTTPETALLSPGADRRDAGPALSAPHAILFDPHSPKKNPAMWTAALFADLFRQLDPARPCALATYTRSTMARVALLLGGFFVGVGHPSGLKEETTVAANRLDLLDEPLDHRWLERAKSSHSAEPLSGPVYRQAPLSPETLEKLRAHPQFRQTSS